MKNTRYFGTLALILFPTLLVAQNSAERTVHWITSPVLIGIVTVLAIVTLAGTLLISKMLRSQQNPTKNKPIKEDELTVRRLILNLDKDQINEIISYRNQRNNNTDIQ